ncbi:hypothetical protein CRYUN_Cryun02cG0132400 [Craigia yunnanensis]
MRIRKRFPSFPTIPSSATSSKEVPSQQEEIEVSSFPAPAEGTAREAPQKVLNDWKSIMAQAHRLLGCSSYNSNYRTIRPHVQEEHSSTNPVSNGETVSEIKSTKERNKKSALEQENPSQTMVIEQGGGNAGKQIFDLVSNSLMKGNCSGTAIANTKWTTVSSSFCKGAGKGIFLGNSKDGKAETAMRIGGSTDRKERTDASSLIEGGSSKRSCAKGMCGLKYKEIAEDEEHYSSGSSIKKKAKTRSLTSIYDDIRSRMPSSSKLNEIEENSNGK